MNCIEMSMMVIALISAGFAIAAARFWHLASIAKVRKNKATNEYYSEEDQKMVESFTTIADDDPDDKTHWLYLTATQFKSSKLNAKAANFASLAAIFQVIYLLLQFANSVWF